MKVLAWGVLLTGSMSHLTREAWLEAASQALEPILRDAGAGLADVRVSCGWPARGALAKSKRTVGECWHGANNGDGHGHIFVSPCKDDAVEVLGILLHELIHAALPAKVKHGRTFAKVAAAAGLDGKPTATTVGANLATRLNADVLPILGAYPHSAIDASSKPKQGTRMRLYLCECIPDKDAGITNKVRAATDNLDATCGRCGAQFTKQETEG